MTPHTDMIILKTKLIAPLPKENHVIREDLLSSLSDGLKGRLTCLCAPAGFGKTSLLAQWLVKAELECAWLSLDDRDNDEVRFWRYVSHSLTVTLSESLKDEVMRVAEALSSLSTIAFIDELINILYTIDRKIILVLDDYHNIHQPTIHQHMTYFIDYLPESVHVVISTRTQLPFSTIKWEVKGESYSIGMTDLQFSVSEAEQLYHRAHKTEHLSQQQVEHFTKLTEGWITGLQLILFSIKNHTSLNNMIEDFRSNGHISDYLFHEVVDQLPDDITEFLYKTAILRRFDASICKDITEADNSVHMLDTIKHLNLFLVPLDGQQQWFRYHHLFAKFLQNALKKADAEKWKHYNIVASQLFAQRGLLGEAIEYAIHAHDFTLVQSYLEKHIPVVLQNGEFSTLLHWFKSIPKDVQLKPGLSLVYAFVLVVTGDLEQAEEELTHIEQLHDGQEQTEGWKQIQSGILFVRSNLVFSSGAFTSWLAFSEKLLNKSLPRNPIFYSFNFNQKEPLVRRTALGLKGILSQDTEKVGTLFTHVLEKHGWQDSLISLYVKQALCEGYYEWNRLDQCVELIPILEKAALKHGIAGLLVPIRITRSQIEIVEQRYHQAHALIEETLEEIQKEDLLPWHDLLKAFKGRIYLMEGKAAQAKNEISELNLSSKSRPTFNREYEYMTLIRLLGLQGKEKEALKLLEQLKPQVEREQLVSSMVEVSILQAIFQFQIGSKAAALPFIHEALVVGEQNGYIRSFIDEGLKMKEVLDYYFNEIQQRDFYWKTTHVSEKYIQKLLDLIPADQLISTHQSTTLDPVVEPLTKSELNLLRQLQTGATNKQMAEALALSEGTVKVYLSRLYEKLHVTSRTQALLVAQELKLL
ncbi:LuxR C-terminal-related transcriptional regulator [Bacillus horti]|uniref:LuxR family maltose regulon positive regulatory protein n=1 Tax=Caldalkalibacillus horti TaxID=77523 RepID=A0ABT9W183_9BACI|nr:LuxR C-terminal-related transcriptional regulator [Bacillus horti]MDQ0167018.1 LuxR family maltose regulon positive regulatory protein [Bacillus horti]